MKNKKLEKMIKNLQRMIDQRKCNEDIELLKKLQNDLEKDDMVTPLSVSFSVCGFVTNGIIGGITGFAVGRTVEEISNRSDVASSIIGGLLDIIHNSNISE